jgi:hypothetical protein
VQHISKLDRTRAAMLLSPQTLKRTRSLDDDVITDVVLVINGSVAVGDSFTPSSCRQLDSGQNPLIPRGVDLAVL